MELYLMHTNKGDFYVIDKTIDSARLQVIHKWREWYEHNDIVIKGIDCLAELNAQYPKNGRLLICKANDKEASNDK